jgi:hypothetical protein
MFSATEVLLAPDVLSLGKSPDEFGVHVGSRREPEGVHYIAGRTTQRSSGVSPCGGGQFRICFTAPVGTDVMLRVSATLAPQAIQSPPQSSGATAPWPVTNAARPGEHLALAAFV